MNIASIVPTGFRRGQVSKNLLKDMGLSTSQQFAMKAGLQEVG